MSWWNPLTWRNRKTGEYVFRATGRNPPNPYARLSPARAREIGQRSAAFFSQDVGRLLSGWEVDTNRIDFYLQSELTPLRGRSRAQVRKGPFGKRYTTLMKSNIVGRKGVVPRPQVKRGPRRSQTLDEPANRGIAEAFADWAEYYCDWKGQASWHELQEMAVATASQDGEFIFRKHMGPSAGPYGYQLEAIDPELLDTTLTTSLASGNEIRLGVEYDGEGRIVRYHFRDTSPHMVSGGYITGRQYTIEADFVIHGFIPMWPDQSRGVPWMHASLERMKHLDKYNEAAIVKARSTASTFGVIKSKGADQYEGNEDAPGYEDGTTVESVEAGTIKDIGDREFMNVDSSYPHQMYAAFVKTSLQAIAAGLDVSYPTFANDLEGISYSTGRIATIEDRELFMGLQGWFIRQLIRPVYNDWLEMALLSGAINVNGRPPARPMDEYRAVRYEARRWPWLDPQKEGQANDMSVNNRTRSRSSIIRAQGEDPNEVFEEIAAETERMNELGIAPIVNTAPNSDNAPNEDTVDDG